jgi:RNA polymerase sigma factor (sigma-70 family)
MPSDLQHLKRYATTGDAHAFRELVQAHAAMVHATALRVTHDAAAAQDVAQETFLGLARNAGSITQCVAAWLHRVAWNRACDAVRRDSTRKRFEQAMAEMWHTDREATWPDIEPHVDEALNELPKELRELLVLYFLEGRTQAEVARYLGKNQATVSRAIERGISAIREALRSRGVIAGAGLVALFAAQPAQAMPVAVQASLGKLSLTGIGASSAITPAASVFTTSTLITMVTTTKTLLAIAATTALVTVPLIYQQQHKPAPVIAAKPAPRDSPVKTARLADLSTPSISQNTKPELSETARIKAEAFIRNHRGLSQDVLLQSPEIAIFNENWQRLMNSFSPRDNQRMQDAQDTFVAINGKKSGLNLTLRNVDDPASREMIEAAFSDDPAYVADWLLRKLDAATFETAISPGVSETSEGVKIIRGGLKKSGPVTPK